MESTRRRFLQQVGLTAVAFTPLAALSAPAGAAAQTPAQTPVTGSPYVIAQPCIGAKDASCVAVCPVECIYEANDQYYIDPYVCISCGACEPECPVSAIFIEEDVPEQWASYVVKNKSLSRNKPTPR